MKMKERSLALLAEARQQGDETICVLLYTACPPNVFERQLLAAAGCTLLDRCLGTVNRARFRPVEINIVANLGFVQEIELLTRC